MNEDLEFQLSNLAGTIWILCGIYFLFVHPLIGFGLIALWVVCYAVHDAVSSAKNAFDNRPDQQVKRSRLMAKNHLESEKRRLGMDDDWVEKHMDDMADYFLNEIREGAK